MQDRTDSKRGPIVAGLLTFLAIGIVSVASFAGDHAAPSGPIERHDVAVRSSTTASVPPVKLITVDPPLVEGQPGRTADAPPVVEQSQVAAPVLTPAPVAAPVARAVEPPLAVPDPATPEAPPVEPPAPTNPLEAGPTENPKIELPPVLPPIQNP